MFFPFPCILRFIFLCVSTFFIFLFLSSLTFPRLSSVVSVLAPSPFLLLLFFSISFLEHYIFFCLTICFSFFFLPSWSLSFALSAFRVLVLISASLSSSLLCSFAYVIGGRSSCFSSGSLNPLGFLIFPCFFIVSSPIIPLGAFFYLVFRPRFCSHLLFFVFALPVFLLSVPSSVSPFVFTRFYFLSHCLCPLSFLPILFSSFN